MVSDSVSKKIGIEKVSASVSEKIWYKKVSDLVSEIFCIEKSLKFGIKKNTGCLKKSEFSRNHP